MGSMTYQVPAAAGAGIHADRTSAATTPAVPAPRRVISETAVVCGGIEYFLKHGTVDMDALAGALAVSRATLYRVAGSRDQLIGEVLWQLGSRRLADSRRARRLPGVDGVVEVTRHYVSGVRHSSPLRRFVTAEPETAARVFFAEPGGVHQRFIHAQVEVFREVFGPELDRVVADPEALAYLYIGIVESVVYAELLTDQPADIDRMEQALRALFTR
jgi:AcrR family transcriptional regulator